MRKIKSDYYNFLPESYSNVDGQIEFIKNKFVFINNIPLINHTDSKDNLINVQRITTRDGKDILKLKIERTSSGVDRYIYVDLDNLNWINKFLLRYKLKEHWFQKEENISCVIKLLFSCVELYVKYKKN